MTDIVERLERMAATGIYPREVSQAAAEIGRLRTAPIAALHAHPGFTEDEKRIAIEVVRAALENKP